MMTDIHVSVLYRTDIASRIPQLIGVFSSQELAIAAMSFDVNDYIRKFADAFLDTSNRLTTSLSDGEKELFLWIIVERDLDCPVFLPYAKDIDADGLTEKQDMPF